MTRSFGSTAVAADCAGGGGRTHTPLHSSHQTSNPLSAATPHHIDLQGGEAEGTQTKAYLVKS